VIYLWRKESTMKDGSNLEVSEIFGPTIQGEGRFIGRPAVFLRLFGCHVECKRCDTVYAQTGPPLRMEMLQALYQIDSRTKEMESPFVVITGGEPFLQARKKALFDLIRELQRRGVFVALETSGVPRNHKDRYYERSLLEAVDFISWSPKLPEVLSPRHQSPLKSVRFISEVLTPHKSRVDIKVVVSSLQEANMAFELSRQHQWKKRGFRVYLMPEGFEREPLIRQICSLIPLAARYGFYISPRLHALIWGNERGR
jgi:organic radical activating enzyme